MNVTTSYNLGTLAKQASTVAITSSETDMLVVTDTKYPEKSQLTLYLDVDLTAGQATSVNFRVYFTYLVAPASVVWYPINPVNAGTGVLTDLPYIVSSATYSYSTTKYRTVLDIPMSACTGFKVTATGVGGTGAGTLAKITAVVRDN